jgi:hypothetical protein
MISHNPHRRRRRRNPGLMAANPRRAVHRRRLRRNPARRYAFHRRRRNPGGGDFFGSLMSTQGLLGVAAVVATPTIMDYASTNLFPSTTGIYDAAAQGAVGLAVAWAVHKFLDKQVGQVVGLVAVGTAVAVAINGMKLGTPNVMSGNPTPMKRLGTAQLATRTNAQGLITMSGYVPASGRNQGNLNGYATMQGSKAPHMSAAPREPGVYYF